MVQLEFVIFERVGNSKLKMDKFDLTKYEDIQYLCTHQKEYINCKNTLIEIINFRKKAKTGIVKHVSSLKRGYRHTVVFEAFN